MKETRIWLVLMCVGVLVFACGQPAPPPAADIAPVAERDADVAAEEQAAEAPDEAPEPEEAADDEEAPAAEEETEDLADAGEPAVEGGTPKLVVPESEVDFGTRRDTETIKHNFVLRNEGDGILEIKNVRASCGCTTTELEKDRLAPGEEVEIGALTNLRGRQGRNTKRVSVTTNDPENPTVHLTMTVTVESSVTIEPARVNFGEIYDDGPLEETVNIHSTIDDLTFSVTSAELTDMDFIEHEIEVVEPGKSYNINIKSVGELPVGNHSARMVIRTDARERPVVWLPISVQVIGPLQIMPPVINIRHSDTPGEVTQQQLRISPGRIKEFELEEVIAPLEDMGAELIPSAQGTYLLRLTNMPQSDILEGKAIILRTNLEEHPEVEIPFNVIMPRRPVGRAPATLTPEQREQMRARTRAAQQRTAESAGDDADEEDAGEEEGDAPE